MVDFASMALPPYADWRIGRLANGGESSGWSHSESAKHADPENLPSKCPSCATQKLTRCCRRLIHGHSYKVEVLLEAHAFDNGQMVYDFGLMTAHARHRRRVRSCHRLRG